MARTDADGPYSLQSLAGVQVPALFERDPEVLKAKYVAWFEKATNRTLYPMQVEMLLIETLAYVVSLVGEEGQIAAEENLVVKASRAGLVALGANRSTPPLPEATAATVIRFTLSGVRPVNVFVPQGTRVSAGSGGLVFTTTAPAVIAAGAFSGEAPALASSVGVVGNGFLPGQISTLLDPVAGVSAVNIATSEGGADAEDVELYRLRVANAFDRVSTGGSRGWYRETAMAVSSAIVDVAVVRPAPCYVDLYPLTAAGAAGVALRDQVKAAFDTQDNLDIRFGDEVTVKAAVAVLAAPSLTVRLRGETAGAAAIAASAGNQLLSDWRQRLAPALAPSEIEDRVKTALKAAGADVVDVEVGNMPFQQLAAQEYLIAVPFTPDAVSIVTVGG